MTTVRGTAVLPSAMPRTTAARVLVEVRDVSLADAPSVVVGSQVQVGVPLEPSGRLPFTVEVPKFDAGRAYGLRVHVDVNGDGKVTAGDLLSTGSHAVLTFGAPSEAEVPLTLIDSD